MSARYHECSPVFSRREPSVIELRRNTDLSASASSTKRRRATRSGSSDASAASVCSGIIQERGSHPRVDRLLADARRSSTARSSCPGCDVAATSRRCRDASWAASPLVSTIEISGSSGTSDVAKNVPPMICEGPSGFATGGRPARAIASVNARRSSRSASSRSATIAHMFATCPSARAISVELFVSEDCRVSDGRLCDRLHPAPLFDVSRHAQFHLGERVGEHRSGAQLRGGHSPANRLERRRLLALLTTEHSGGLPTPLARTIGECTDEGNSC